MVSVMVLSIFALVAGGVAGLSSSDIQLIVDKHNEFRSAVNPSAKNMMKMYWNEDIARHAQEYADTCPEGHGGMTSGLGISIGQNLAWGHNSWESVIGAWHDEVVDFQFGVGSINGKAVGHYTQVVRDHATHVGCGYKLCPEGRFNGKYYVCNYAYAQSGFENPYELGSACAACPGHCKNNMCDCGDTVCQNRGVMDPSTCTCSCTAPYTGQSCQELNCPTRDEPMCGTVWPKEYCEKYSQSIPYKCPIMCELCEASEVNLGGCEREDEYLCSKQKYIDYKARGMCAFLTVTSRVNGVATVKKLEEFCPALCETCDPAL